MDAGSALQIEGGSFEVDGARFTIDFAQRSTADRLFIAKPPELVEAYARLIERCRPQRLVEIGIFGGGSTALLALLARPAKLVAVELDREPITGLADLIERRGLSSSIRPYYGIDQADRVRLAALVDQELGDEPLDLVIDDASHLLDETRSSFETLFPRLRPNGISVIEDWPAHHRYADAAAATRATDAGVASPPPRPRLRELGRQLQVDDPERFQPLTRLLVQLILARASSGEAVAEVSVDAEWITVRRGPGLLDPDTFRVTDLYTDHFGLTG